MSKGKILVTGGLGFIGSHTAVELINAGYEVVIVDDLSNSQLSVLHQIEELTLSQVSFYKVNMTQLKPLQNVLELNKDIDAVIHFAAFKAVGESFHEPTKYFQNNLVSLINLLQVMEQVTIKNLVFSSSATVYGDPDELPVTEETPFKKALSAYGSTKQMGEEIIEKVSAAKGINSISLRYFNPVGAHESGLLGELPIGTPNNLMPFIIQVAGGVREELVVFGNDYNTKDGTCVRDYIHVVDLAKAHVKSCDRLLTKKTELPFEVFNIGTGTGYSVLEVIKAFENFNNVKLNYRIGKRRPGDAPSIYADASKANKHLNWSAVLQLKDMVTSSWKWQQTLMVKDL